MLFFVAAFPAMINVPFPAVRITNLDNRVSELNATTAILASAIAALQQQRLQGASVPPPPQVFVCVDTEFNTAGTHTWSGEGPVTFYAVGGGGAGGSTDVGNSHGGGGGGGAVVKHSITFTSMSTFAITVGAGGTAVSATDGNAGGSSNVTIAGTTYQAGGGGGGQKGGGKGAGGVPVANDGVGGAGGDGGLVTGYACTNSAEALHQGQNGLNGGAGGGGGGSGDCLGGHGGNGTAAFYTGGGGGGGNDGKGYGCNSAALGSQQTSGPCNASPGGTGIFSGGSSVTDNDNGRCLPNDAEDGLGPAGGARAHR